MVDVGFKNFIDKEKVVAVLSPSSTKAKRLIKEAILSRKLINCTHGRKTGSLVFLSTSHLVLSSLKHTSIKKKLGFVE